MGKGSKKEYRIKRMGGMRTGKNVSIIVSTDRCGITDDTFDHREDGSEWYKVTTVRPIVPYSRSWFVLQHTDGKCVLGAVDGEGSGGVVIPDAYKMDMKQDLPIGGTPKYLLTDWAFGSPQGSFINPQQPVIIIGTDQDVHLMNAVSFNQIYTYQAMLHVKVVNGDNNFSPDWLVTNTY